MVKGFLAENWCLKWTCLSQSVYRILRKDLKMKPYKKLLNCYWRMSIKLSGKNSFNWARKKFSERRYNENPFFRWKNVLILTVSITVEMIVYGPLIGRKQIGEVKNNSKESLQKSDGMVSRMLRGRCVPLVLFEKGTLDHHRYIKEVLLVALRYGNSRIWKQLDLPTRQRNTTYSPRNARVVLPRFSIDWQGYMARRIVPIWILWITVFGTNSLQTINWNKVTSKSSLISELKRDMKKDSFGCCKGKLFRLDESFVSHDTKRWKLSKKIKSSLSDRKSKDESF